MKRRCDAMGCTAKPARFYGLTVFDTLPIRLLPCAYCAEHVRVLSPNFVEMTEEEHAVLEVLSS